MRRYLLRSFLIVPACLLLIVATMLLRPILPSFAASASISLSLTYGPPTSSVTISGKGFKSSEIVTISFDSTQVSTPKASSTGTFSSTIAVPASALPGNHYVQAKGKTSGAFAQATFLVQTDWSQTGFNRVHSGYNSYENVLGLTNVGSITQDWTESSSDCPSARAPVNVGNIVYTAGDSYYESGNVCAANAVTGLILWTYQGSSDGSAPIAQNGLVYYTTYSSSLVALNATTGAFVWSFPNASGARLGVDGVIYTGTTNHKLYALNGSNGAVLWTYTTVGNVSLLPALSNNTLYVVTSNSTVSALNAKTGKLQWSYTTQGTIDTDPTIANTSVYVASDSGTLYALNSTTGAVNWKLSILPYTSLPSIANGLLYITSNCNLYTFNASTGSFVWNYISPSSNECEDTTPTIANGVVYVGTSNSNYTSGDVDMFNATTGQLLSMLNNSSGIASLGAVTNQVVVTNGELLVASGSYDTTYAFHLLGTTP